MKLALLEGELLMPTPELCRILRKPLGILIPEPPKVAVSWAIKIIKAFSPPKIVTVGDEVTLNFVDSGIKPSLSIVDGRIRRKRRGLTPQLNDLYEIVRTVINPPGCITKEAWDAVQDALFCDARTLIKVVGEEDLLTLAAAYHAPLGTIIAYGQPREGLVLVPLDRYKKDKMRHLVLKMVRRSVP